MRKIKFDEETINSIRDYINEGHSKEETCNRFTLKMSTLNKVMFKNNIYPYYSKEKIYNIEKDTIIIVCKLYQNTFTSILDISKQVKLPIDSVKYIINNNFTVHFQNTREMIINNKSCKSLSLYKGITTDGKDNLICLKPDWYTGRKGCNYVFLSSVIMCQHLGLTELPKGFIVYNIDGNKHNVDINNLALMSVASYSRLQSIQTKLCKVQRLSNDGVGVTDPETPDKD